MTNPKQKPLLFTKVKLFMSSVAMETSVLQAPSGGISIRLTDCQTVHVLSSKQNNFRS